MKILHTSDIHIDSPMTARLSHAKATERKKEILTSFRRMIDTAVSGGYSAVIIAGDLFDNERVGIRTLDAVVGAIEAARDLTFFYLPGNHEKQRLSDSGLKLPENLKIFGNEWTYFKIGGVNVAGRCSLVENMFDSLSLNTADMNIVVLHGELSQHGGSVSKIGISDIEGLPIDYLALGHYHTFSEAKIGKRTSAVYCGTPEGRGFDEAGTKGFVTIEISELGISHRFSPFASRLVEIIHVDISGKEREIEIEEIVESALAEVDKRSIVRVVLTGEHTPEARRNTDAFTERFAHLYYYLEIKDESRLKISSEDYKNDKSLKGEFIRLVLASDALSEEDKSDIIECGIRALAGEIE